VPHGGMSLRRNVVANYFGQGWTALMGLLFIPVYISYLGIEAYGLIGIFALLQAWLSLLDLGLTPAIGREMARFTGGGHDPQSIRDLLRSVEIVTFTTATMIAVGIWLGSDWLATTWLHAERIPTDVVAQALTVMGVVVAMRAIENVYRGSIIGLQRQVALNMFTSVMATVRAIGAVAVLALVAPTVTAYFAWQLVVSTITVCVLAILVHHWLPTSTRSPRFSLEPLRGVWRFAAGTLLITLLGFLLSQSDKLILSSMLSLSAFAIYSIAYAVANVVRVLAQPIDLAVFPRLTQLHEEGDEVGLADLYHKATQYTSVLMGGVGLFLAVFGHQVLALWMQDAALAAATYSILWILVIGMILYGLMNNPYSLQLATGWTGLLVKANALMVMVFVPVTYALTLRFGMTGAAVSWVLINMVYVLVVVQLMHRRLLRGELRAWYTNDLVLPLSAGGITAVVLRELSPAQGDAIATVLFLGLSLVSVVFASALAASYVRGALTVQLRLVLERPS
jgi:O-antigen/teichoic acid export membrane protein